MDSTKTIVLTNHKGGDGKTSCSIGLAYALSKKGYHVLAIDADPQGNFTDSLSAQIYDLVEQHQTIYDAMYEKGYDLTTQIYKAPYKNLDVLASDSRLNNKTQELTAQMGMFIYPYRDLINNISMQKVKAKDSLDIIVQKLQRAALPNAGRNLGHITSFKTNEDKTCTITINKAPDKDMKPILLYLPEKKLQSFTKKYNEYILSLTDVPNHS